MAGRARPTPTPVSHVLAALASGTISRVTEAKASNKGPQCQRSRRFWLLDLRLGFGVTDPRLWIDSHRATARGGLVISALHNRCKQYRRTDFVIQDQVAEHLVLEVGRRARRAQARLACCRWISPLLRLKHLRGWLRSPRTGPGDGNVTSVRRITHTPAVESRYLLCLESQLGCRKALLFPSRDGSK